MCLSTDIVLVYIYICVKITVKFCTNCSCVYSRSLVNYKLLFLHWEHLLTSEKTVYNEQICRVGLNPCTVLKLSTSLKLLVTTAYCCTRTLFMVRIRKNIVGNS